MRHANPGVGFPNVLKLPLTCIAQSKHAYTLTHVFDFNTPFFSGFVTNTLKHAHTRNVYCTVRLRNRLRAQDWSGVHQEVVAGTLRMSGDVRYELEPCGECSTLHITFTRRPSQGSRSHRHAHSTDTAHRRAIATASVSTGERKRTIITRTPHLWPLWAFPFSLFMCALVCVRLRTCVCVRVCTRRFYRSVRTRANTLTRTHWRACNTG